MGRGGEDKIPDLVRVRNHLTRDKCWTLTPIMSNFSEKYRIFFVSRCSIDVLCGAVCSCGCGGNVFLGVECAARLLKRTLKTPSSLLTPIDTELALDAAAKDVRERQRGVCEQLEAGKLELRTLRPSAMRVLEERFEALEESLVSAAMDKDRALKTQAEGIEGDAEQLRAARERAEAGVVKGDARLHPLEVIQACQDLQRAHEAVKDPPRPLNPVRGAGLQVQLDDMRAAIEQFKNLGSCGALDVDATKCVPTLPVGTEKGYVARLSTSDSQGNPLTCGGAGVRAWLEPSSALVSLSARDPLATHMPIYHNI